jgi:pimeloyl-ACP methyl ester carboxylesterase
VTRIESGDAVIAYDVLGDGPAVVLLHAFPLNSEMWRPVAERLAARYRVVLMDLRGHGNSSPGDGRATMEKHAADVARVCDAAGVSRAVFAGVSLGGYVVFECWRRFRERFTGIVLADTKAQADDEPVRAGRLQAAEKVEKDGPDQYLDGLLPKLIGASTQAGRPDLVAAIRQMAARMTVAGIAAVQRGMAQRPDSVPTLNSIRVPALLLFGGEDTVSPVSDGLLMQQHIPGSRLQVSARGGHVMVFEQPDAAHDALRKFLDELRGA